MTDFSYIAVDKTGKINRGRISSSSPKEVGKILVSKGMDLISCQKEEDGFNLDVSLGELFKQFTSNRVTPLEKISFAHHLAIMLKAGVPIIEAVEALKTEKTSFKLQEVIKQAAGELEQGKPLSSILIKEEIFSPAHLAILKAGEASGKVAEALNRIGDDLKRDYKIKKKLKGAMAYPAIITLTLLAVTTFIIVFVLPKVGGVFRQMNLTIPLPTKILLAIGSFISQYFKLMIGLFLILAVGLWFLLRRTKLKTVLLTKVVCHLPLIKKLIHEMSMARFIRSLSALLASGVPIAQSLTIAGEIFIDLRYRRIIGEVEQAVKKGISLTEAFKVHHRFFEGIMLKMCSVGEKSGQLVDILEDLALFYEEEVEEKLDNFSTVIEPVLMLLVGLGVGGMVLSIIGPIYQMMGKLTP